MMNIIIGIVDRRSDIVVEIVEDDKKRLFYDE
jgi:hypothetical protein